MTSKTLKLVLNIENRECQKIVNLLNNTATQSSKSRTKNWVEINHVRRGACKSK